MALLRHVAALLALLLLAAPSSGSGTLLSETSARLDSLRSEQGHLERELAGLAKRETSGLAELDRLEQESASTRSWLASLDEERRLLVERDAELREQLNAGGARLDSLTGAAAGALARRDTLQTDVAALARRLYPLRRMDPWSWLLSSESARQGLKRLRGWPRVHESLARRLAGLQEARSELLQLADAQRQVQADLSAVREAILAGQRRNAENRQESERGLQRLAKASDERRGTLAAIRSEKEGRAALARRTEQAGERVGELLASLRAQWAERESGRASEQRRLDELGERLGGDAEDPAREADVRPVVPAAPAGAALAGRKGRLPRPVAGRLSRAHGLRTDPTLGTILDNPGADYDVAPGDAVRLVHEGRVERITWVPGYGNTVLVGHAGGGWTVYARLGEVVAREGQVLATGAPLGRAGEAEDRGRAAFHFELWIGDQAQDPELWFQR